MKELIIKHEAKKQANNIKEKVKFTNVDGHACLHTSFILCNFFVVLISLGIVGCAVYLYVLTKDANVFSIGFIIAGVLLLIFSLIAFRLRKSIHLLGIYLLILGVITFFMVIITIVMIINKSKLLTLALAYYSSTSQ